MRYSLEQLNDLECIREVARIYCRGVDRLDEALLKSAYWPEATDHHGSFVGNAHKFAEHCMTAHLKWRATSHCIFNHSITLTSATEATGEIYNVSYLWRQQTEATTGNVLDTWHGRYLDRYEKRADVWRIIERVCVHEGTLTTEGDTMPIDADQFRQGSVDRNQNNSGN